MKFSPPFIFTDEQFTVLVLYILLLWHRSYFPYLVHRAPVMEVEVLFCVG